MENTINSNVRIPEDIWEEIRKIAQEENRSINSQIIFTLKKYIEEQKKKAE